MGRSIHARRTPGGIRYREWSSIVDAYTTPELTEGQLRTHLLKDYSPRDVRYGVPDREIPERIARANDKGTSAFDDERDINGPWDAERCEGRGGCGGFHHPFNVRDSDGTCAECGEKREERWHGPPCGGG